MQEKVSTIDCEAIDLSFKPADTMKLKVLSPEQVSRYNSAGFVQPLDVYSAEEIHGIRGYVDELMDAKGSDAAYGINCYQARLKGLWNIANERRILDYVEDIIGPDIVCWASAILSKQPHDPKRVPWHQDAAFWKLTPARTVTVWLAIDDADEQNSAMRFIANSHHNGKLQEAAMGRDSIFHKGIAADSITQAPVVNSLKAGQISLHADMLVHGSLANRSSRRRCALTLRYCPPDVRVTDKLWAKGIEAIICRGQDRLGHWRHHPRPATDDIRRIASPHVVGNN